MNQFQLCINATFLTLNKIYISMTYINTESMNHAIKKSKISAIFFIKEKSGSGLADYYF